MTAQFMRMSATPLISKRAVRLLVSEFLFVVCHEFDLPLQTFRDFCSLYKHDSESRTITARALPSEAEAFLNDSPIFGPTFSFSNTT